MNKIFRAVGVSKTGISSILGGITLVLIAFLFTSASLGSGAWANMEREPELQSGIGIMAHDANVDFEPKWSPANTTVDYTVEICVEENSDPVDEVRIYRHMNDLSTYTDFVCEEKTGWSITPLGDPKESCLYIAQEEQYYIEDDECEIFEFSATTPELVPELCNLDWRFETRDIGEDDNDKGEWKQHFAYTNVDDVPPTVEKTIIGDHFGNCPPGDEEECWIRQYPNTNISVEVKEQGIEGCVPSGLDFCEITYILDDADESELIVYEELDGAMDWSYEFGFEQDSRHELNITCRDVAGNVMTDIQNYRVDNTPPETEKYFVGPQKEEYGVEWINSVTEVHLNATDPDPTGEGCNVGVEETKYHIRVFEESENMPPCYGETNASKYCEEPETYCKAPYVRSPDHWDEDWETYNDGPIEIVKESCHVMQYYSVDSLGNVEGVNYNCFFVDRTEPEMDKEVGQPRVPFCEEGSYNEYTQNSFEHATPGDETYEFDMDKEVDCERKEVIWTLDYDEETMPGITHTAFQVLISHNQESPVFNVGLSSESAPMYKEYNGGWGSATDELPYGMDVTGEIGDTYFEVVIPFDYLSNEWYWAVNVEGDFSGTSGSSQYHYPSNWVRWTAENTEKGQYLHWMVTPETDIDFTCVDEGPHPSGDEEFCFKVWYDLADGEVDNGGEEGGYVTEEYCDKYDGTMENGACCVSDVQDEGVFTFNFNEDEDSEHILEYFCRDAVEKATEVVEQHYRVDSTPPTIEKTMVGEEGQYWYGDCPPGEGEECYVAGQGGGIDIDVYDPDPTGMGCNVGDVYCEYKVWLNDSRVGSGNFTEGTRITFDHDSTHTLVINCEDALGNSITDEQNYIVDSTPPETVKTYGEPTKLWEGYRWITSDSTINLTATDEKTGVESIMYRVTTFTESMCHVDCDADGEGNWTEVIDDTVEFTIPQESCHLIEYYSIDQFGNTEDTQHQCVMVDNTPPVGEKTVGEPKIPCEIENGFENGEEENGDVIPQGDNMENSCWWVKGGETEISLGCNDQDPHPVGQETVCYRVHLESEDSDLTEGYCDEHGGKMENGWCCEYVGDEPYTFVFGEDSNHSLEFYCRDHLGNEEETTDIQWYRVDSTAPETTKNYLGPHYEEGGVEWIDTESRVELVAEDGGEICAVGGVETYYRYEIVDDSWCWGNDAHQTAAGNNGNWDEWNNYTEPFHIDQESCHMIEYFSKDALGNEEDVNTQYVFVDKTPPTVTKTYGEPYYVDEDCWTDCIFSDFGMDGETEIETMMSGAIWTTRDDCGEETQNVNGYEIGEEVWVNGHKFPEGSHSWTIEGLPGKASCHPGEVVASGTVEIGEDGEFCMHAYTVGDDDCGTYKANVGGKMDNYHIIGRPPENDTCILENCSEWITSETPIWVDAVDEGPHPSGIDTVEYRITMVEDEYCHYEEGWYYDNATGEGEWNNYTEPFYIGEESCHLIEIRATDNVEKTTLHKQCVFVDNTPPEPMKEVGEPKVVWDGADANYYDIADRCWSDGEGGIECWKVTTMTPLTLGCVDPDPHPVGHETLCYMIDYNGDDATDDYCGNYGGEMENGWCCGMEAGQKFYFENECEHNLQYFCRDVLGNEGSVDDQKFKVTGTSFNISLNKKWNLISVPFVMLDNSIEEAFNDVEDDIISVWTYDSMDDEWLVYSPEGNEMSNTLTEMHPGWGYWVLTEDEGTMVIGGSLFQPGKTPSSRILSSGWNLIGYYGTNGQLSYEGPQGNGRNANYTLSSVPSWKSLVTYWEAYDSDEWIYGGHWDGNWRIYKNRDEEMDPGAGYWIALTEDGEYWYASIGE